MLRVWFNHWFSTSYKIIEMMKEDKNEEIYVIGSNRQRYAIIQNVCDEWYEEPDLDGEDYITYCLEFCRQHSVDVFVPRRKMVEISKNKERFSAIGVKVLVDDYSILKILNDKASAYEFLRGCQGISIPEYAIVNDWAGFETAYGKLKENHEQICMKFVQDEGGMSFRKIVDHVDQFNRLRYYQGAEIEFEVVRDALKSKNQFDDLMVMPYLPGNEISVDCLSTPNGLIAVARVKGSARHEKVAFDEKIMEMTRIVLEKTKLQYPCNVQYKIKDEIPYFLEINTRMSGGLQMSCLAAEVNIPNIALNKLIGRDISWEINQTERMVSYIELPQLIQKFK
ncbi:ATP-grasp domain-containing protein [Anaeromicropila populeti]|uniref:ATP-grasp domain-containing protein n=1 Tax=Anaeromicropila populeti TaxID=37658 RepID=A0A1I6IF23_9FIRM|nr:ATP-grasp domain-containing protein [Anaeromicropila populeti]SFR65283.1 ATP-grasp domain-containing protein [Anaeromicropila populeti]